MHKGLTGKVATKRTLELLELVGIPEPHKRLKALPHELSGGQRQRVMIAMALANEPELLIADEPTTALDVTVQLKILELLKELQARLGMSLLLISHDLNLVRSIAHRVCVMQRGCIVEQASCESCSVRRSIRTPGNCSAPSPAEARRAIKSGRRCWKSRPQSLVPDQERLAQTHGGLRQGGGRHQLQPASGQTLGIGRKRFRQIHAGPGDFAADRQQRRDPL
jgi:ABC-type glutathione transport system ATPase component